MPSHAGSRCWSIICTTSWRTRTTGSADRAVEPQRYCCRIRPSFTPLGPAGTRNATTTMHAQDEIVRDLEIMSDAGRYHRWILSRFMPHLGNRIVELGAGIGTFTFHLLDREQVIAVDIHG